MTTTNPKLRPRLARLLGVTAAAATHLLAAAPARADAIVTDDGCKANTLARGDGVVSAAVDLGFEVNFGGTLYAQVYVDTDGALRFGGGAIDFGALRGATWVTPPAHAVPFVAPFHADVDTSEPTSKAVTYGPITFGESKRKAFCVNWVDVRHGGGAGPRNTFQLVLAQRAEPGAFDVIFNYSRLEWEDDSHAPFVGYFDGRNQVELPGSRERHVLLDGSSSGLVYGQRGGDEVGRYVLPVLEAPPPPAIKAELTGKALRPDGQFLTGAAARSCDSQGLCVTGVTDASGTYKLRGFEGADVADVWKVELAAPPGDDIVPPSAVFFSFPSVESPVEEVETVDFAHAPSCVGFCGGFSPGGCFCDELCEGFGDCCPDKVDVCDGTGGSPASCQGEEGTYCGSQSPGGCFCDDQCNQNGNCCPDKADVCDGSGTLGRVSRFCAESEACRQAVFRGWAGFCEVSRTPWSRKIRVLGAGASRKWLAPMATKTRNSTLGAPAAGGGTASCAGRPDDG
ncbi:MAG TPA: nidogen-like domain-containing protein [Polyangiaceae bacterium]|nr:nidogen-like domain-containing protein [Polyangiaceae bacterium]